MIDSVIPFAKTALGLILASILGVTGHVSDLSLLPRGLRVEVPYNVGNVTMGEVILGGPTSPYWISHEVGHIQQQDKYGPMFDVLVGVPSLLSALAVQLGLRSHTDHVGMPFEWEATQLGNGGNQ